MLVFRGLSTIITFTIFATTMSAQELKQLTLEELNYGGKNYFKFRPESRTYSWWGNQLVRKDGDKMLTVSKNGEEKAFTEKQKEQYADWCKLQEDKAVVKDHNIFIDDKPITIDGTRELVYGEIVHRNEFGIETGLFWSPDKQRLAFYRMDQSMVTDYPQVNIDARIALHKPDKYPMAGETSHQVTVGVYDTTTGKTIYLQTPVSHDTSAVGSSPADNLPVYFTNIAWSPDSKLIYMFELNRDQNDCRLVSYDATTGARLQELYRETSEKYVEPIHPIVFLPWDDSKALMQSQKDGYNHLYLVESLGATSKNSSLNIRPLTSGEWVVMDVLGFNTKDKSVIIRSNELSPIQANIFAVDIKTGKRTLLDNGRGYHNGVLSEDGTYLLDSYSEPTVPRCINITATTINIQSKPSTTNLLTAADPWNGYEQPGFICGTIKAADGVTDLYYRMVVPAELYNQLNTDTEGHKLPSLGEGVGLGSSYPTVVYVYGGPHAHNVDARWHYSSRSWERYMAQKGYIIFILDNRGSENRGLAFEQATFRQLGQVEMEDQMQGVEFLKSLPYVDTNRIGVHGWSFGGFMTITLMTNHPDIFKVGVAGGPVIDWKWYEVMYGERYMDTPQQNPEGYEKTSLIPQAKNLKGKLQIITGYNDETVVPQHCLSFLAECIKEGTQPDFFVYPGEPHNMRGHQSVHLHERITQYFEDYLK
ncbi:MAG: DPP IV N-terminal domain-containing protein [Prevotella sp.]|nr:DPP IV N-terminal domain-containing protein [Prevotella sp.]